MKKIFLSLVTIVMVSALAVQATRSEFTDGMVLGENEVSMGTVSLDENRTSGFPIIWTNIAPGATYNKSVSIRYMGSLNADLWVGVGGTSEPGQPQYIADFITLTIIDAGTSEQLFKGLASELSTVWKKIATDIPYYTLKTYNLTFEMSNDIGNDRQGVENKDTLFKVYAVETEGPHPEEFPYLADMEDYQPKP
jgi:hypothetical protein